MSTFRGTVFKIELNRVSINYSARPSLLITPDSIVQLQNTILETSNFQFPKQPQETPLSIPYLFLIDASLRLCLGSSVGGGDAGGGAAMIDGAGEAL